MEQKKIKKGDLVEILKEYQDEGDDEFTWVAVDDEDKGRVTVSPINSTLTIQFNESLFCFDNAISIEPTSADLHYNRGIALMALTRFTDAISSFDLAIKLNKDHYRAHYRQGLAFRHLKQFESELVSYERAIAINPAHEFLFELV